jgi:DNA-binding XRE family transcriptional regulator
MLEYGTEILGERKKRKIRQDKLTRCVGIHRATLVDIENKKIGLDDETYQKIVTAINDIDTQPTHDNK